MPDTILILDFGSQVTQLIARRLREAGIYTEILPCTAEDDSDFSTSGQGLYPLRRAEFGHLQRPGLLPRPVCWKAACQCWGFAMASKRWSSSWAARLRQAAAGNLAGQLLQVAEDSPLFQGTGMWAAARLSG